VSHKDSREFAAYVRGDHPHQVSYKRYVLGQLRAARSRARLAMVEIDSIGVALKSGAIDPDQALADLAAIGSLPFMQPSEPPFEQLTFSDENRTSSPSNRETDNGIVQGDEHERRSDASHAKDRSGAAASVRTGSPGANGAR